MKHCVSPPIRQKHYLDNSVSNARRLHQAKREKALNGDLQRATVSPTTQQNNNNKQPTERIAIEIARTLSRTREEVARERERERMAINANGGYETG